jgi:hypothetical protein
LVVLQVPVEPSHVSISVPKRGFNDKPAMCHISVCTAPTGRVWRRPDTKREAKAAPNGMAMVDMKRCRLAVRVCRLIPDVFLLPQLIGDNGPQVIGAANQIAEKHGGDRCIVYNVSDCMCITGSGWRKVQAPVPALCFLLGRCASIAHTCLALCLPYQLQCRCPMMSCRCP